MKHTNAVGVGVHVSSMACRWCSENCNHSQAAPVAQHSTKQPERQFSTAVIFWRELLAWTFLDGRRGGKMRKAWLSRSTVCSFWCYLILIPAAADERPLRWRIRAREMSAAPETLVCRYLRTGQHIWLGAIGELYQHAMQLLISQKIDPWN